MGNRLSKIYTRTGDDGTTGLGDGSRVPKDSPRVEAYGTVDEANSAIGVVLSVATLPPQIARCLTEVQHDLFDLGGELCIPGHRMIEAAHIERLETELDAFNEALPPLKEFILPGGSRAAEVQQDESNRPPDRRVGHPSGAECAATAVQAALSRLDPGNEIHRGRDGGHQPGRRNGVHPCADVRWLLPGDAAAHQTNGETARSSSWCRAKN